ncbi:Hint domain-containing protein [Ascidiaceihabitans sp.]|uniref:Hint domain-containing protein n=1 Tax=Ascidiaceihabitans sp. TaxID=1872644 RepID=UPI0032984D43
MMPTPINDTELLMLQDHMISGNRAAYYSQLEDWGYAYGTLAGAVATDYLQSGRLANLYLVHTAEQNHGVTLTTDDELEIGVGLMQLDFAARSDINAASRSGEPLAFETIQGYHEEVFIEAGLDIYSWTATVPLEFAANNPEALAGLGFTGSTAEEAQAFMWDYLIEAGDDWFYQNFGLLDTDSQSLFNVMMEVNMLNGDSQGVEWIGAVFAAMARDPFYVVNGNWGEPYAEKMCFVADTKILLSNRTLKPIEQIRPGDIVTSYDTNGNLVPAKVVRTFANEATHILDFFGTGVTPGHVFFCGEGRFKDQHVTLLDILRSDGGVVDASGKIIRACTGDEVGSDNDTTFVWAITGTPQPDGTVTIADRKQLRLSTRVITKDGRDLSLADIIFAMNATVTDTGMIRPNGSDTEVPLHWTFSPNLPAPEDYVLQRSGVTLEDIFAANEWEQRPKLPAPTRGEAGPSFVKSVEDVKGMFR